MLHVNSKKTLQTVTRRFMKANRNRNFIILLAVVMTTVMFTALFSAALSLFMTQQQMEMHTNMDSSYIRAGNLTKTQFEALRKDEAIKEQGYTIYLAPIENESLGNVRTELFFADEKGAESRLSKPDKGALPKAVNETAMSTITLDLLGIPHKVGSTVELTYTLGGKTETATFVLSGYWKGDQQFPTQPVWISEDFCKTKVAKATRASISDGNLEGTYDLALWLDSPFGLAKKVETLDGKYGITREGGQIFVNTAYELLGSDGFVFLGVGAVLLIIFAAGNLIIYNVFVLSVKNDMKAYGLLMNSGVTGKQLKKIVRIQAAYLFAVGIPLGLVLGYLAGKAMTPYLIDRMDYFGPVTVITTANPLIFLGASLLSAVTVYLGCQRPARMVSKLSPVEAVRNIELARYGKGKKSMKRISPIAMAIDGMRKSKRKVLVVMISLALPIVILNSIYAIARGFHFEYYVDAYINMDFTLSGCTDFAKTSNLQGVTPDIRKAAENRSEVESAAVVYNTENLHSLSDTEAKTLQGILKEAEKEGTFDDYTLKKERQHLDEGKVQAHIMGLSEDAFLELEFDGGDYRWQDFNRGDYVIVGIQNQGLGQYYRTGEKVKLDLGGGRTGEYTVLAIGELNYELQYPFGVGTFFDYTFMLPEDAYLQLSGKESAGVGAMIMGINVKDGMEKSFDSWLKGYIEEHEMSLYVDSRLSLEEEARDYAEKYYLVLGLLCGVLFVIGILNFFNTMAVSILSRKKELALLSAVGMTRGQILKMLIAEGVFYLLGAVLIADTLGAFLSLMVIKMTVGTAFFFTPQVSIVMSLAPLPVMILIACIVPLYLYGRISRETVTVRLRVE